MEKDASSAESLQAIVKEITEKKGTQIMVLDLSRLDHAFCRYFVICTGGSSTQVGAIADGIERGLREKYHLRPWTVQGRENQQWVLMDYGDTLVHIFQPEPRAYYRLEDLWADADVVRYDELGNVIK